MIKLDKEFLRLLMYNKFGPAPKFLAQFLIETEKLNEKATKTAYKDKRIEFKSLCNEYKEQLEASISSSSLQNNEHTFDESPISNKPKKKNPEAALFEKFKTPLVNKTNGVIVKQTKLVDILNNHESNQEQTKTRKRSALMAEMSVLQDETSSDHADHDEHEDKELKKSLFKSENDTKTNNKIKTKSKKTKCESKIKYDDNDQDDEANTSIDSNNKIIKNPSKKLKLNNGEDNNYMEDKSIKKSSNKKKIVKSSHLELITETSKKTSKKTKKGKKTKAIDLDSNEPFLRNNNDPKTPGSSDLRHHQSRLELLQSTVKKTIKKRPMTRRAAAAAAAAAAINKEKETKDKLNLKQPCTLKKINKFEFSVAKSAGVAITLSAESAKTPNFQHNKIICNFVNTSSKLKSNFRTSIDERKARTSQAKLDAKRKSVKKAQAILKSIHNERKLSITINNNNKINNNFTDDEEVDAKEEIKIKPSRISTEKEKEIIENILKSDSPKIVVQKIPTNIFNSNTISASKLVAFTDNQKRLTKDLPASAVIQQNYRILPSISKITTPAKSNLLSTITNPNCQTQQNRISFIKFLERNTPSKLTRAEFEEKQKAELVIKESKEKERLAQLEKQKQQQLEDKKKKREEKMKKINELKLKTQLELEKKQREQQIQITASKPTVNSCLNFNQPNKNTSSAIPLSTSSNSLSFLNKKNAQQTTANKQFDQNDLSTFSTELNNFKQMNENLKKASIALASSNTDIKEFLKENQNLCETTYVLNSPNKQQNNNIIKTVFTNYQVTPLQPPKLKNQDNYDVSDLRSEDETDDDEEPSKPVPDWARDPKLVEKVKQQAFSMFNFTRLFKTACQSEIVLEDIFKIRRKKFTERSSSANWNSSPIWKGNGINGEESFWQFKKNY